MKKSTGKIDAAPVLGSGGHLGQLPESVVEIARQLRTVFGPHVRLLHAVNHATGEVHGRAIWDDVQAELDQRGRRL